MGYLKGLVHGAVLGTVAGICIAPQEGARTRAQLQRASDQAREGYTKAQATARRVAPTVQTAARSVGEVVGQVKERVSGRDDVSVSASNGTLRP